MVFGRYEQMAQETEGNRTTSATSPAGIARVGKRAWGYDIEQVDAFLERAHRLYEGEGAQLNQRDIQEISFDCAKGGYEIAQVDAALQRLERAVVDKQTTWEISRKGRVAWKADTEELYRLITEHVDRAEGERFSPGVRKRPSYDRKQVDRLVAQIADKAASVLGVDGIGIEDVSDLSDLDSTAVANAVFTQRKGPKGYDERQVDYFLNACVRLLSRLESYGRVAEYVNDPSGASAPNLAAVPSAGVNAAAHADDSAAAVPGEEPPADAAMAPEDGPATAAAAQSRTSGQPVSPLFAPAASAAGVAGAGYAAEPAPETFDALHKAEQAIFAASAPSFAPAVKPVRSAGTPVTPTPVRAAASAAPGATPVSPTPAGSAASAAPAASNFSAEATATMPAYTDASAPAHEPAVAPVPASAPEPADSSLAALAHMAEVSQEMPVVSAPSEAQMPSLEMPSLSKLDDDFPSLLGETKFDVDIPDLSFPSPFSQGADAATGEHSNEKKEQ